MITIDDNKYNEVKNILNGCKNINDAKYFTDLYIKKNPESKKLVNSMKYGKIYDKNYDNQKFLEIMKLVNDSSVSEQYLKIINDYYPKQNNNNIQIKTLLRIIEIKNKNGTEKEKNNTEKEKNKNENENKTNDENTNNKINFAKNMLTHFDINSHILFNQTSTKKKCKPDEIIKKCPHDNCGKEYIGNINTNHVICGYGDIHNGYNWEGCQRDWCFACGKKLCKSWDNDKLYLEPNRIHNSECCKQYCLFHKESYDNYCHCNNKYVNRNRK